MQKRAKVETIAAPGQRELRGVAIEPQEEKPDGAKAGWILCGKKIHFQNPILTLREDTVGLPNGEETKFAYVERAEAVIIVPVTSSGEMVMVKQYRYAVDEWAVEVPAGGTHDAPNESLEQVARKVLKEEVGGICVSLTFVDSFYSAISITGGKCHVYLAEGVELSEEPAREASETLRTELMPVAEVLAFVQAGKMKNGPCALAILLCEPVLVKNGYLGKRRASRIRPPAAYGADRGKLCRSL
jgi:ADP-ribose pyrophosphatase